MDKGTDWRRINRGKENWTNSYTDRTVVLNFKNLDFKKYIYIIIISS